jgi:hypothetical protein
MASIFRPGSSEPIIFHPYQWSVGLSVFKVVLYPVLAALVGAGLLALAGNQSLAVLMLVAVPAMTAIAATVVGLTVSINRRTVLIVEKGTLTKKTAWGSRSQPLGELREIDYHMPLRGALDCELRRRDGSRSLHFTVAPWTDLRDQLDQFSAQLGLPLRPHKTAGRFRLYDDARR